VETDEAVPMWTPLDRIPWEEMWEDDPLWIPLMLEGKGFQARFLFDGDTMVDWDVLELAEPLPESPSAPA
jgi:8-oxo-dGTP diphosphatase